MANFYPAADLQRIISESRYAEFHQKRGTNQIDAVRSGPVFFSLKQEQVYSCRCWGMSAKAQDALERDPLPHRELPLAPGASIRACPVA